MRARPHAALTLALATLLAAAATGGEPAQTGVVRGRVELGVAGARMDDLGPIVVTLDAPEEGSRLDFAVPTAVPEVRQSGVRFRPRLLVVTVGQRVALPNEDAIYHNVFSFSKPNDFDLGLYPQGESRSIVFRHPGVVRTYCSIHESMSGTIFVAPNAYFAVVRPSGDFEIRGVAPGRYRLTTWCERLPAVTREIQVDPGKNASVDLVIGSASK